jgi:hypothetical protein
MNGEGPLAGTRVLPFTALLDAAVRATRRHFLAIYPGVAVPLALVTGVMTVVQLRVFRGFFPGGSPFTDMASLFSSLLPFAAVLVLYVLVQFMGGMAMVAAALAAVTGTPIPIAKAWAWTLRPRVGWTMTLWSLAILAGALFCILPGIWVGLLLAQVVPVMAAEQRFGKDALARSASLMRHNPERRLTTHPMVKVLAISFVAGLLGYAANLAVTLPLAAVQQIFMFRSMLSSSATPQDPAALLSSWWMWLQVPQSVLGSLVATAVSVYASTAFALLYVDLKNRKEGRDLEALLDELGAPRLDEEPLA